VTRISRTNRVATARLNVHHGIMLVAVDYCCTKCIRRYSNFHVQRGVAFSWTWPCNRPRTHNNDAHQHRQK